MMETDSNPYESPADADRDAPTGGAIKGDLLNLGRGFLMGGADIIPGVSGGTVALILGIYTRLVTAISHFDLTLLRHLRKLNFAAAAKHVDLRFLAALGLGIGSGVVLLARLMNFLITDDVYRPFTLAAFFGMILASSVLVGKMVQRWSWIEGLFVVGGIAFAFQLTGLTPRHADPTLPYTFFCGMIAICAMILPGISGAFILLLLGMYLHVTDAIKGLPRGDFSAENLMTVITFCAGAAIGLIAFSKFLRWLLARHEAQTMAILAGFMLGSLRKIWPFQLDTTLKVVDLKKKIYVNFMPEALDGHTLLVIGVGLVALIGVFALERFAQGTQHVPPLEKDE